MTASGETLGACLDWWEQSERRASAEAEFAASATGSMPDEVILSPDRARARGLTSTICFPMGNLAPEGSVIKSTAIDPVVIREDGVFFGIAGRRACSRLESDAIEAIRKGQIAAGDVMVLICCGPLGAGMQEIYQITAALKASAALPACGADHGCALQRRLDGPMHRAYFAGSSGRRTGGEDS